MGSPVALASIPPATDAKRIRSLGRSWWDVLILLGREGLAASKPDLPRKSMSGLYAAHVGSAYILQPRSKGTRYRSSSGSWVVFIGMSHPGGCAQVFREPRHPEVHSFIQVDVEHLLCCGHWDPAMYKFISCCYLHKYSVYPLFTSPWPGRRPSHCHPVPGLLLI